MVGVAVGSTKGANVGAPERHLAYVGPADIIIGTADGANVDIVDSPKEGANVGLLLELELPTVDGAKVRPIVGDAEVGKIGTDDGAAEV